VTADALEVPVNLIVEKPDPLHLSGLSFMYISFTFLFFQLSSLIPLSHLKKRSGEHPRPRWTRVFRPAPTSISADLEISICDKKVFVNQDFPKKHAAQRSFVTYLIITV